MERLKWLFTLESDYSYKTNLVLPEDYYFHTYKGDLLVYIAKDGTINVYKGYAWDGCSPKLKIGGQIIGTPDGKLVNNLPQTYHASLIHDVLYQYIQFLPIKRSAADRIFLDLLAGFRYKYLYYAVVRLFGGFFI